MGHCSGKSTVGKLVASALKYPFLDSDTLIEQLAGCTISDIFREEGEESFREVESQVLQVRLQRNTPAPTFKTARPGLHPNEHLLTLQGFSGCGNA